MPNSIIKSPKSKEFFSGVSAVLPILIGVVPFGLIFGILGLEAGFTANQTFFMSSIIFAGASQVAFVKLVSSGTIPFITIFSVGIINLRHFLYSASIAKYLAHLPTPWKIILSYLLTDEAYAVSIKRMQEEKENIAFYHYHLFGSGITLWLTWQTSTFLGIVIGQIIPEKLNLGFAIPLVFLSIIAPEIIKYKSHAMCALSAGILAIFLSNLPLNLWIIFSSIFGLFIGVLFDKRPKKSQQ